MTEVPPSDALHPSGTEDDEKLIQDETKLDGSEKHEIQSTETFENSVYNRRVYNRQCQLILGIMRKNAQQQNWTATQIEEAEQKILQANGRNN